jgi:hypothetical protein
MDGDSVFIVNPTTGKRGYVPRAEMEKWEQAGYQAETAEGTEQARVQEEYGDSPVTAALQGAARTITLGGSDVALRALGQEDDARHYREQNAGASLLGEAGGAVLTAGVGLGGAVTSAGKAAGAAVTGGKAATRLGTKLLAGGAQAGAEGLAYGAQMGVSEVALSDKPADWESAAATIGSNAITGAGLGFGIGVGGRLLEESAVAAKGYAARKIDELRAGPAAKVDRGEFPEIAAMDKKTARAEVAAEHDAMRAQRATDLVEGKAARAAELEAIEKARDAAARELHAEAVAFKEMIRPKFIPVADSEARAVLRSSKRQIMNGLDDAQGFIESRGGGMLKSLRKQEGALNTALKDADDVLARADVERQALLDGLPKRSRVPSFDDVLPDQPYTLTAKELERSGLYELPGAGVDETRMARVKAGLGKPEAWDQPIRLTMDSDGRMAIEDGRHRLRAALEEGGERPLQVHIDRGGAGWSADSGGVVQLGKGGEGLYLTPEQSKLYADFAGVKMAKGQPALAVGADDLDAFRAAIERGDVHPPQVQRVLDAQEMLEGNRMLQGRIKDLRAPAASDKLAEIDARLEQARAGVGKKTARLEALEAHVADLVDERLGKRVARGAGAVIGGKAGFMVGGPLGALAGGAAGQEAGARLYDRLIRKLQNGNAARGASLKSSVAQFFGKAAEKTAKAVERTAPLATKILPGIQYARRDYVDGVLGPANQRASKDETINHFRERARELNALTERAPDGSYTTRMAAREQVNAKLAALWAIDPTFANGAELTHTRRLEYLASKLPRDPSPPHLQVGPDDWEPSKADVAKFARIMEVAERPEVALERLAAGTMTPEDAETLRSVYPAMYSEARADIMAHIAEYRETLPYAKRLNLSIMMDAPVDRALVPEALTVYQRPKPPLEQQQAQAPTRPLPQGMVAPTQAQRMSSK